MPTAAKLVAAIILSLTGYLTTIAIRDFLPEEQPDNFLIPVSVIVPIFCAWLTLGRMVGGTYRNAINAGVYGVFVSIFYVVSTFAIAEMLKRSMKLRYDGPMEAVVSMFGIAVDYGAILLNPPVAMVLVGGAVVSGIATEWTDRRWA
ncbi:MAG: TrgA family protein [Litoreibacter sp.]